MTTRTISASAIAALQAVRSVIADATGHPGQQAAIEAIDRLAAPEPDPATVIGDLLRQHFGSIGPLKQAATCETCGALHDAGDLDGGTRCLLCLFMDTARAVREGRYSIATQLAYGDRKRFDKFNEAFDRLDGDKGQAELCSICNGPMVAGQKVATYNLGLGPAAHQTCADGEGGQADEARAPAEQPLTGYEAHWNRILRALDLSLAEACRARGIAACDGLNDEGDGCAIGGLHTHAAEMAREFALAIEARNGDEAFPAEHRATAALHSLLADLWAMTWATKG